MTVYVEPSVTCFTLDSTMVEANVFTAGAAWEFGRPWVGFNVRGGGEEECTEVQKD